MPLATASDMGRTKEMMERISKAVMMVFAAAFLFVLIAGGTVIAQEEKADPAKKMENLNEDQQKAAGGLIEMFNEKLKHRYAPVIRSVQVGDAKSGSPISVTVKASYDTETPVDRITEAAVFYVMEGKNNRLQGPFALASSGDNTFSGSIPAVEKSGKMYVIPWVRDSYGNVGVEMGCNVSSWPPFEDPCMVPGAVDAAPVDDPAALIEDDYDVWEFQVGMDDKYVYFMVDVEGLISKGTLNPPHINMYLSMLVDTQALYEIEDIMVFMSPDAAEKYKDKADKAAMIIYAPLAPSIDSKIKECFIPRAGDGKGGGGGFGGANLDSDNVSCKDDGSTLFTRVDKSILSKSMLESFSAMGSLNGFVDNPQVPLPTLREILPVTKAAWNPHVVTVK